MKIGDRLDYEVRINIPARTNGWGLLVNEIPRGASLRRATLVMTNRRAYVLAQYVGTKPDGSPHKRPSTMTVPLSHLQGKTYLGQVMSPALIKVVEPFLPE